MGICKEKITENNTYSREYALQKQIRTIFVITVAING